MKLTARFTSLLAALCLLTGLLTSCISAVPQQPAYDLSDLPEYDGTPYVVLNDNMPLFAEEDKTPVSFEYYSELDELERCGPAYACVSTDTMPTEKRGPIGSVKPSGWQTAKYDNVDGKHLYNRCHLLGFQLTGENANAENLITGTRYLNTQGMLPFENLIADYVKETGNHVLYRVTPIFQGVELVARGVQMEGWSVEDEGEGVCFHVFAYNVQPGINIHYLSGLSWAEGDEPPILPSEPTEGQVEANYVLNTKSKKFHHPDCPGASKIADENRQDFTGTRASLLESGYSPCGTCKP